MVRLVEEVKSLDFKGALDYLGGGLAAEDAEGTERGRKDSDHLHFEYFEGEIIDENGGIKSDWKNKRKSPIKFFIDEAGGEDKVIGKDVERRPGSHGFEKGIKILWRII